MLTHMARKTDPFRSQSQGKRHVVYFWQGRESSTDEKAASGLLAREVSDTRAGGVATQVRVVQGKEPEHFCSLFRGRMVVRSGGKASGFRNVDAAVRVVFPKSDTHGFTEAGDCCPYIAIYKTDTFR